MTIFSNVNTFSFVIIFQIFNIQYLLMPMRLSSQISRTLYSQMRTCRHVHLVVIVNESLNYPFFFLLLLWSKIFVASSATTFVRLCRVLCIMPVLFNFIQNMRQTGRKYSINVKAVHKESQVLCCRLHDINIIHLDSTRRQIILFKSIFFQ